MKQVARPRLFHPCSAINLRFEATTDLVGAACRLSTWFRCTVDYNIDGLAVRINTLFTVAIGGVCVVPAALICALITRDESELLAKVNAPCSTAVWWLHEILAVVFATGLTSAAVEFCVGCLIENTSTRNLLTTLHKQIVVSGLAKSCAIAVISK